MVLMDRIKLHGFLLKLEKPGILPQYYRFLGRQQFVDPTKTPLTTQLEGCEIPFYNLPVPHKFGSLLFGRAG